MMKTKKVLSFALAAVLAVSIFSPANVNAAAKKKATATVTSVTSIKNTSAKVKFKVTGVKNVQCQYATDKNFKKSVKSVKVKANGKAKTVSLTGLKANTTYYFRVKGLTTTKAEKKKYKVSWSKVKSFKTKASTTPTINFQLKQSEITLMQGKTMEASTLLPDGISTSDVTWKSSDSSAVGYEFGEIYAEEKIGNFTINVTYKGKTVVLTVHVIENPDYQGDVITFEDAEDIELQVGETHNCSYLISDDSSVDAEQCTWVSKNEDVLTFDNENYKFTCHKAGTVVVEASYNGKTASATFTVIGDESEIIFDSDENLSLTVGESGYCYYLFDLDNCDVDPEDCVWVSKNEDVLTFDNENYKFTCHKAGTVKIEVTYNGKTASTTFTVTGDDEEEE